MSGWLNQHRKNKAREIVKNHLHVVVSEAQGLLWGPFFHSTTRKSKAYFLSHAHVQLDTTQLKRLLGTDDDGVMNWVNQLSETKNVLEEHGLMFVHTHTYANRHIERNSRLRGLRHLTIVCEGSTPNRMTWPGA